MKERFEKFIKQNCKYEVYDLRAYMYDLIEQFGNTGSLEYEMSKYETKSGNPELFNYTLEELQELY